MFDAKTERKISDITYKVYQALTKSERDETKEQDVSYAIVTDWYDDIKQFQKLKGIRVIKIVYSDGKKYFGIAREIDGSNDCEAILTMDADSFSEFETKVYISNSLKWLAEKQK